MLQLEAQGFFWQWKRVLGMREAGGAGTGATSRHTDMQGGQLQSGEEIQAIEKQRDPSFGSVHFPGSRTQVTNTEVSNPPQTSCVTLGRFPAAACAQQLS